MQMIELLDPERIEHELARSLAERRLPDHFLYTGDAGTESWIDLDRSREFAVARRLTELLRESLDALVAALPPGVHVAGIGIGSGEKERRVLERLVARGDRPSYFPVDVSAGLVRMAGEAVKDLGIDCTGITARLEDVRGFADRLPHPLLLTVLGNNFCNYEPGPFFASVSRALETGDRLLFDCHLFRGDAEPASRRDIESAYQSPPNVRFNLGPLLARGVPEEACRFDLELVRVPTPGGEVHRTRKTIAIRKDVEARCGEARVRLAPGDVLEMGFTYKYTADQLRAVVAEHGFRIEQEHPSADGANILLLLTPP